MSNTNGHVNYAAVLKDLEEKRDQIDSAIAAIKFMIGGAAPSAGSVQDIPPHAFFTLGIVDATKKYLEMAMRKQTIPEIVEALQQGGMPTLKPNTVYAALRRRESIVGDIVRIGEDDWGLKEWIKNAPVPKRAQKTKKAKKRAKAKGKPRPRAEKVSVDASSYASVTTEQEAPAWVDPKSLSGGAGMTIADAAEEILKKAGKPLHLKELAAKLGEYGKRNTTQGLSGNLNQDRLKRLVNLGGNMWALAEWPEEKRKVKAS